MSRGPLAATDRRRQAGHKNPRRAGASSSERDEGNGAGHNLAHLFRDRRKNNGSGKRAS